MELPVFNIEGKETGRSIALDAGVFGIEPNEHVVYLDVKRYLANKRQGTHKTKERSEITGSTRKIKKQKGTGTARAGSIKSPVFVGGGRVFGPKPRDYSQKINKKVKKLARCSALSYKAAGNNIIVLEDFSLEEPKTKKFLDILKALGVDTLKTLFVIPAVDKNIFLSARNLPKSNIMEAVDINTYSIVNANKIVLIESSVNVIQQTLK